MMATGFVQAQDCLVEMNIMRREGEDDYRKSRSIDRKYDKLFRTINLQRVADSIAAHLHPETKLILEAFADGVNAYIDNSNGKYPVEFDMLNYKPEHWKIQHSFSPHG